MPISPAGYLTSYFTHVLLHPLQHACCQIACCQPADTPHAINLAGGLNLKIQTIAFSELKSLKSLSLPFISYKVSHSSAWLAVCPHF